MRTTIGIDIAAPPALVFGLARDVERWPALLPHYAAVRVKSRHEDGAVTARMIAVRSLVPGLGLGIPVVWRARTWADEATLRLRFRHLGGATAGMDVTWRIEAIPTGCHVSIEHDFATVAAAWAAIVDRLFVRPIAGRTLASFKSIAEAVVAVERTPETARGRSEPPFLPKTQA